MKKGEKAWGRLLVAALLCGLGAVACATQFVGDPKFPDGVNGCRRQCASRGLEMGSFIYMGEYSTACACRPVTRTTGPSAAAESSGDEAAVAAGVAGVEMQMQRQAAEQHSAAH